MCKLGMIFACSFITCAFVSADKSFIMINDSRNSWISLEGFASLVEISLNTSKCANVYLSDNSADIENLFNDFVQIYPYEYTVNDRMYWCNGYLAVSTSADIVVKKLSYVPTKISTTELLIFVTNGVEESTGLFNVSMYENANVNIAARNGLWSLSENFLEPRKFNKISRYDNMKHKRGLVDLQGRKLQVAAFYYPPLCYLISTTNQTVNGIEAEIFIANEESELDGIETKLFLLLAERLNFTWTIRKPNHNYRYGRRNGSTWHGGMIGQMFRKEIDMAFTGIWLQLDHYLFTNLSRPWANLAIHFLVPRPQPYTSFWALTRPLSPRVWCVVLSMILLQSGYVYVRAWIDPRVPTRFRSFVVTWTELMARLVGIASPINIQGLKLQLYLWHLIGVLLVTAYSSSLEASLASSRYEARIDTTKQFIMANLTWGREGAIPNFNDYFGQSDPWAVQLESRFTHEESELERHRKITNGNYAIIGQIIGSIFFPENSIRDDDMKGYRLMRRSVGNFFSSFAVQPWLLIPVDKVMLRLGEAGLIAYHLREVLDRRTTTAFYEVLVEHDGIEEGAKVLEMTPLGAGFSMLLIGAIISTIVFYHELKSARGTKSILEVLRDIKKKRELRKRKKLQKVTCRRKLIS